MAITTAINQELYCHSDKKKKFDVQQIRIVVASKSIR